MIGRDGKRPWLMVCAAASSWLLAACRDPPHCRTRPNAAVLATERGPRIAFDAISHDFARVVVSTGLDAPRELLVPFSWSESTKLRGQGRRWRGLRPTQQATHATHHHAKPSNSPLRLVEVADQL